MKRTIQPPKDLNVPIELTTLVINRVVYRAITTKRDGEIGDITLVFAVTDTVSGQTGHIKLEHGWFKRETEDTVYTDNPALFEDNHPDCDWYAADELNEFLNIEKVLIGDKEPPCDHELKYNDGPAGWGLYA